MLTSYNPATNTIVWQGQIATEQQITDACFRAKEAFQPWKRSSFETRAGIAKRFADLLEQEKLTLAKTISEEMGKPLWESLQEVQAMKNKVAISIQAYEERCKNKQEVVANSLLATKYHPHGIVAVFGPFNFPGHLPNGHIVPALLAGNTVLFKPSELTPAVGEMTVKLWHQAGLPAGVLQLLQGGKEVAISIASKKEVNAIFFTGSALAGQAIARQSLEFPGRVVALEMGGNNPLVISNIKDIKLAVFHIIQSAFLTSGQRCSCARRLILIENAQTDELLDTFVNASKSLQIGAYTETPEPYMGPVVSQHAKEMLLNSYSQLLRAGGKSLLELRSIKEPGHFLTPSIVDMTGCVMKDEELFGPILQCIRVKNLEEAITTANQTAYGLSAGIISDSKEEFEKFYSEIEAGIVNWNTPLTGASSSAPFGGIKKSGNGHPSAYLACDYCSYPVASMQADTLSLPATLPPGMAI